MGGRISRTAPFPKDMMVSPVANAHGDTQQLWSAVEATLGLFAFEVESGCKRETESLRHGDGKRSPRAFKPTGGSGTLHERNGKPPWKVISKFFPTIASIEDLLAVAL